MSDRCFILNAEQARRDWSGSRTEAALAPVPLANGTEWVLPVVVLERSAHAAHHDFLRSLPEREIAIEEYQWWQDAPEMGVKAAEGSASSTRLSPKPR